MLDPFLRLPRYGAAIFRALTFAVAVSAAGAARATVADHAATWVKTTKVASKVVYEFSRDVGPGRIRKGVAGADGFVKRFYLVKLHGDKLTSKQLVDTVVKKPVDTVMLMGRAGYVPSRSSFCRGKVRTMIATGYDPSPATIGRGATGRTCTGRHAEYGCIAVDPRVIPFGTLMYVEGYGFGLACDRGSAIKGNRIDLCFNQKRVADRYGRRAVRVHILKNR
ncbi:MAG: 3D domain-containing protein [Fimbriimonadaceae bacterium]